MSRDAEFEDLYQEVILDHYKRPRHQGPLADYDVCQPGKNPLCGDELVLYVKDRGGCIDTSFTGHGCSISQASASIMVEAMAGREPEVCQDLIRRFEELMRQGLAGDVDGDDMTDIDALSGVRKFPVRIKCAALAWKAMELALAELAKASNDKGKKSE